MVPDFSRLTATSSLKDGFQGYNNGKDKPEGTLQIDF